MSRKRKQPQPKQKSPAWQKRNEARKELQQQHAAKVAREQEAA